MSRAASRPLSGFLCQHEETAMTTYTVSDTTSFNNAIAQANAAIGGTVEIDFTSNITLNAQLTPLVIDPNVTVVINGQGATLNGADTFRGLFVYSGNVVIENLEISHCVARGGNGIGGGFGGGGAAGLGGGLFVADDVANGATSAGNVTLVNVGFDNDKAIGGNGASGSGNGLLGGGGGMGGSASNSPGGPGIGPNGF